MRLQRRKLVHGRRLAIVVIVLSALGLTTAITLAGASLMPPPAAPAKPVASPMLTKARVTWVAPANNGSPINQYTVTAYVGTTPKVTRVFNNTLVSEVITGLVNGTLYTFRVRAHNAGGSGPYSVASNAIKVGTPLKPPRPRATRGNATVRVDWGAPAANGVSITGYVVTPIKAGVAQTPRVFSGTLRVHNITSLVNGTAYTFKVAAKSLYGTGAASIASLPATPTAQPALSVTPANNATIGQPILVDSNGMTVYLFVPDGANTTSAVTGGLRGAWPYVLWGGPLSVGPGLNLASLTANIQPDGTRLLAYNGHLLYTFISDHAPGDATGQGLASFFVLDGSGNKIP